MLILDLPTLTSDEPPVLLRLAVFADPWPGPVSIGRSFDGLSFERIALALRTREGIPASELKSFRSETNELIALELLRECHGNLVLTRRGKTLADSIAEALV